MKAVWAGSPSAANLANNQFQWWIARRLYMLHWSPGDPYWRDVPIEEKSAWRTIALLGIYST